MTAPSAAQGGAYQGYPFTSRYVIDPPSLDAETASKWANLPRNPIVPIQRPVRDPAVSITVPETSPSGEDVIHDNDSNGPSRLDRIDAEANKADEQDYPTVYIDFPTNEFGEYINGNNRQEDGKRAGNSIESEPSSFVEDTIFYDPFEDRRIDVGLNQQVTRPGNGTGGAGGSSDCVPSPAQQAGSSSIGTLADRVPAFMSKESYVYGPVPGADDNLPQPSIPEPGFPEPPPAYSEIDTTTAQPAQPPRTEVIVPGRTEPTGEGHPDRKLVRCSFCDRRVYTMAINENGPLTHAMAVLFLCVFAPITVLVYCTDYFKYRNHYCPNCNRLIGYEVPSFGQKMVYTENE